MDGSHVVSDGWTSYANIDRWNNNIYTHEVLHQENFINPNNPDVHTQNIENLSHLLSWMGAKKSFVDKVVTSTSEALFTSYLHEFVWRNSVANKDLIFNEFLKLVMLTYRVVINSKKKIKFKKKKKKRTIYLRSIQTN